MYFPVSDIESGRKNIVMHEEKGHSHWYAVRAGKDFDLAEILEGICEEIYFPVAEASGRRPGDRRKAIIPHVLFIRTTKDEALSLETRGKSQEDPLPQFWIYRYSKGSEIAQISEQEMQLLRLLTATDSSRCEIYRKLDFEKGEHVRITAGQFAGHEGYVQRVKKNKHVIVRIEGVCAVMLPFIHPDLLEKISDEK